MGSSIRGESSLGRGTDGSEGTPQRYAIIYTDWGGALSVVAPMTVVKCSEDGLRSLGDEVAKLLDGPLDGQEDSMSLEYVDAVPGEWIEGHCVRDRVLASDTLWVSDELTDLGVQEGIGRIVTGQRDNVGGLFEPDLTGHLSLVKSGRLSQDDFERIVVQVLHCVKDRTVTSGRLSRLRDDDFECTDIVASTRCDDCLMTMWANCVSDSRTLQKKLDDLVTISARGLGKRLRHSCCSRLPLSRTCRLK